MLKVIFVLFCAFAYYVLMLEFTVDKKEVTYVNPKYYRLFNFTIRKASRRGPLILNMYQYLEYPVGNNLTIKFFVYEIIAGREILTPMRFEVRECDALKNDPYIGRLFAENLPKGWVCPFPVGYQNWTNMVINLDYFPYLPFTYSSISVRACLHIEGYINNELAYKNYVCGTIRQKVTDKDTKREKKSGSKLYS